MTYGLMLSRAVSSSDAKQKYINGHFCYEDKLVILTNGFGIIRHISFLYDYFRNKHPKIMNEKKFGSPNTEKAVGNPSSSKPVLSDFFTLHPHFNLGTFLGDSAFDKIDTYGFLKNDFHFRKVLIPYSPRNENRLDKVGYSSYGNPSCPNDSNLNTKYLGFCRGKGCSDRYK